MKLYKLKVQLLIMLVALLLSGCSTTEKSSNQNLSPGPEAARQRYIKIMWYGIEENGPIGCQQMLSYTI